MSKKVKLSTEYPVVDDFKEAFKRHDSDVKVDQIKGFDRRVRGSPLLMRMVMVAQKLKDRPGEEEVEMKRMLMMFKMYRSSEKQAVERAAELEAEVSRLKAELQEKDEEMREWQRHFG